MNIELLDQDELAVEFLVRHVDGTKPGSKAVLAALVAEENSGKRPRPPRPHPYARTLTSELAEVQRKMAEIGADLHQLVTVPDVLSLERCHTRMLHLRYRLDRCRTQAGYSDHVGRIEVELENMWGRARALTVPLEGQQVALVAAEDQAAAGGGSVVPVASDPSPPQSEVEQRPPVPDLAAILPEAQATTQKTSVVSGGDSSFGRSSLDAPMAEQGVPVISSEAVPPLVPVPAPLHPNFAANQFQSSYQAIQWADPHLASVPRDPQNPAPLCVPSTARISIPLSRAFRSSIRFGGCPWPASHCGTVRPDEWVDDA